MVGEVHGHQRKLYTPFYRAGSLIRSTRSIVPSYSTPHYNNKKEGATLKRMISVAGMFLPGKSDPQANDFPSFLPYSTPHHNNTLNEGKSNPQSRAQLAIEIDVM